MGIFPKAFSELLVSSRPVFSRINPMIRDERFETLRIFRLCSDFHDHSGHYTAAQTVEMSNRHIPYVYGQTHEVVL